MSSVVSTGLGQIELAWLPMTVVLALAHLTWMLAAIGGLALLAQLFWGRMSPQRRYAINLWALLACTLAVPAAFYGGRHQAAEFQPVQSADTLHPAGMEAGANDGPPTVARETADLAHTKSEWDDSRSMPNARTGQPVRAFGDPPAAEQRPQQPSRSLDADGEPEGPSSRHGFEADRRPQATSSPLAWLSKLAPWVAWGYVIGMVLMIGRLSKNLIQCHRLIRTAKPIEDGTLQRLVVELADRMSCRFAPLIAASERVAVPVLVGLWRPMILVPTSMITGLTPAQWESVLLHELSHLRRRDHWVNLWQRVLEAILFFHPAVWLISRNLDRLREDCCDDLAMQFGPGPIDYTHSLCSVADLARIRPTSKMVVAATGAGPNQLIQRVQRILGQPETARRTHGRFHLLTAWPWLLVGCLAVGLAALFLVTRPDSATGLADEPQRNATTERSVDEPPRYAIEDCVEMDGIDAVLVLRGEVVLPDGQPAPELRVSRSSSIGSRTPDIRLDEHRFEVRTKGEGFTVHFETADGRWRTEFMRLAQDLRQLAQEGVRLTLEPFDKQAMRTVPVLVIADDQPVAGASVKVADQRGVTDSDGRVDLQLHSSVSLESYNVIAWTDEGLLGVSQRLDSSDRVDGEVELITVPLAPTDDIRIKVSDRDGRPVQDFELMVLFATRDNRYRVDTREFGPVLTDERGVATVRWRPSWTDLRMNVMPGNFRHYRPTLGSDSPDGWPYFQEIYWIDDLYEVELEVRRSEPRRIATGRVAVEGEPPGGLLIRARSVWSEDRLSDIIFSRASVDGRFTLAVLPGRYYHVRVEDPRWVCNSWTGMVWDPDENELQSPQVQVEEGVPIEIVVTEGADKTPVADAEVRLGSPQVYNEAVPPGQRPLFQRRSWFARTDEQGIANTWAAPGELSIDVRAEDWSLDQTFHIGESANNRFLVHHAKPIAKRISGRLKFPESAEISPQGIEVLVAPIDGSSVESQTIQSGANGKFEVEMVAQRIAMYAETPDRKWSGVSWFQPESSEQVIEMVPTVQYRGRLVDEQGAPVANAELRLDGSLPPGAYGDTVHLLGSRITHLQATTDDNGDFEIERIPTWLPFRIYRTDGPVAAASAGRRMVSGQSLGTRVFLPGDNRPGETLVSRSATEPMAPERPKRSISEILHDRLLDCHLNSTHCLVIVSGDIDREPMTAFVQNQIVMNEAIIEVAGFLPLIIDGQSAKQDLERVAQLEQFGWFVPDGPSLLLVALDANGAELGRRYIEYDDPEAVRRAGELIRSTAPAAENAARKLQDAIAEADRTDRTVWVRVSQTRCAPCFPLARWLDEHRELLEQDFVMVSIDNVRDIEGVPVIQQLFGDRRLSVPAHFFFDGDGREIASGYGPMGNIGFPQGSYAGTHYLIDVLSNISSRLSEQDLLMLGESLYPGFAVADNSTDSRRDDDQ